MRRGVVAMLVVSASGVAAGSPAPTSAGAVEKAEPARGPGGDPLPPGPFGEIIGTLDMALVRGLSDVDDAPATLDRRLSATPPAGLDVSALGGGSWLHGEVPLTKTEALPFAVSADRMTLVLDSDRDGRLEADERVAATGPTAPMAWFGVQGLVRRNGGQLMVPMKVGIPRGLAVSYSRLDARREGVHQGATRKVRIAIVDRTFRGWFSHPGRDALLVDVDGDGRFDSSAESTERYRLGEPFPLDGVDAVVKAIGPFGSTLTLARSPVPARRIASLAVGAPAPAFEARALDGRTISLASLAGRWVLLDFWATWCKPCRDEIPNLLKLAAEQPGLAIVGISGDRSRESLEAFVAAQRVTWPQILDGSAPVQRAYRVASFPRSFLVDPDGRIAARDLRGPRMSSEIARLMAARGGGAPPAR